MCHLTLGDQPRLAHALCQQVDWCSPARNIGSIELKRRAVCAVSSTTLGGVG